MKVIFVTVYNAQDVTNWSGTPYYMANAFSKEGIEVEYINNLNSLPGNYFKFRLRSFFYNTLLKKKLGSYISFYEPENLKHIAKQVEKKIKDLDGGIIFSPGAIPIAYLNTNKPVVLWTDATFAIMNNYYTEFTNLNKITLRNGNLYEKSILKNANLAIFSSKWAATSAINDYGADPSKIKIISYGANIECDRKIEDINEMNKKKSKHICKLLFIGQDWDRKGGNEAVEVAKELNNRKIKTELTIVGCNPPDAINLPDYIKVKGFIKKSEKQGEDLINTLYSESHFFILPTIAECTPIVFSEANSFGLPVLTTNTGGIGSVIINDVNGKMFGSKMNVLECVEYIERIFNNYSCYNTYSLKSFNEYLVRLNWSVAISKCISYMKSL